MGCDQTVSPTYTEDLARATLTLITRHRPEPGIYHLVNEGECSWYEFTLAIYELMNLNVQVIAVDRKGVSGDMKRPLYSVLENTKAKNLHIELPKWKNALSRYLRAKYVV